jgi:ABC-type metal ion transport system, periplasmic component/surface antigen
MFKLLKAIKKDNPYINCIVARTEDKDNPIYKKIVEAYQTDEVAKVVEETYGDLYLPAWNIK